MKKTNVCIAIILALHLLLIDGVRSPKQCHSVEASENADSTTDFDRTVLGPPRQVNASLLNVSLKVSTQKQCAEYECEIWLFPERSEDRYFDCDNLQFCAQVAFNRHNIETTLRIFALDGYMEGKPKEAMQQLLVDRHLKSIPKAKPVNVVEDYAAKLLRVKEEKPSEPPKDRSEGSSFPAGSSKSHPRQPEKVPECTPEECKEGSDNHRFFFFLCDRASCEREKAAAAKRIQKQHMQDAIEESKRCAHLIQGGKPVVGSKGKARGFKAIGASGHDETKHCKCDEPKLIFPVGCRIENQARNLGPRKTDGEVLWDRLQAIKASEFWTEGDFDSDESWESLLPKYGHYLCWCKTHDEWVAFIGNDGKKPNEDGKAVALRNFYYQEYEEATEEGRPPLNDEDYWLVKKWRQTEECEGVYATKQRMIFALSRDAVRRIRFGDRELTGLLPTNPYAGFEPSADDVEKVPFSIQAYFEKDKEDGKTYSLLNTLAVTLHKGGPNVYSESIVDNNPPSAPQGKTLNQKHITINGTPDPRKNDGVTITFKINHDGQAVVTNGAEAYSRAKVHKIQDHYLKVDVDFKISYEAHWQSPAPTKKYKEPVKVTLVFNRHKITATAQWREGEVQMNPSGRLRTL